MDQERIRLDLLAVAGADKHTVSDRPEIRVTLPTVEIFAVKQRYPVLFFLCGDALVVAELIRPGGHGGVRENQRDC